MKTKVFSIIAIAALAIVATLILTTSCAKKTDCVARVTCIDANGRPISNADVRLFANCRIGDHGGIVTADLKASGLTDNEGKISFTFKLPAIYDIKVMNGSSVSQSIIKLEEGKTADKIVTIQ